VARDAWIGRCDVVALHTETTLEPSRFARGRAADYRLDVPVAPLAPGDYLLTLTAGRDKAVVTRTLRFSVTP
jgi:hypothetical protein